MIIAIDGRKCGLYAPAALEIAASGEFKKHAWLKGHRAAMRAIKQCFSARGQ
jgi:hypothetical protein